jgi:ABC-type sulfate/molybdate transport systems ATPase subunit
MSINSWRRFAIASLLAMLALITLVVKTVLEQRLDEGQTPENIQGTIQVTIEVKNIVKKFGAFAALDNVDLKVAGANCWRCLVHPVRARRRCCGSLQGLTGLTLAKCGSTADALGHGASERHVGSVFQHYALFRHMTVFENVAFVARSRAAVRKDEARSRARQGIA